MKMKTHLLPILLTLMLASPSFGLAARRHTFHTSLMQIDYNEKEQLVEISIQVFSNDLENALSRRSGKVVRLEKTPDAAKLILVYLNEKVNLKNRDGVIKTLSWVGMERQADAVWLYVESTMPEGFEGVEIRNRILFDLFGDQVNLVHIKVAERKYDFAFKPGDDFKAVVPIQRGGVK